MTSGYRKIDFLLRRTFHNLIEHFEWIVTTVVVTTTRSYSYKVYVIEKVIDEDYFDTK